MKKTSVFILIFMLLFIYVIYKSYDLLLNHQPVSVQKEQSENKNYEISDYLDITGSSDGYVLKDNRRIFLSRGDGNAETVQLFIAYNDKKVKITNFENAVEAYFVSPDEKHIALLSSEDGNEQSDIYIMDIENNFTIEPVLVNNTVKYDNVVWADSNTFLYTSNEINGKDFNIYSFSLNERRAFLLVEKSGYNIITDAQSSSEFLFYTYLGNNVTEPYIYKNKKFSRLKGSVKNKLQIPVGFFDKRIMILSNEKSEFTSLELWTYKGDKETVYSGSSASVESVIVDKEMRNQAVFCINNEGYSSCSRFSVLDGEFTDIKEIDLPKGVVTLSQLRKKDLVFSSNMPDKIPSPVKIDLETSEKSFFGFTWSADINVDNFVTPELVRIKSFDSVEIPFFIYKPRNVVPPYKTIIYFHGGPESQFRPIFITTFQYYLNQGYMIVAPNVRGSSGYGRKYMDLDNYKKRMDAVKDVGAVISYLTETKLSEKGNFTAMGGSYGGFMTVASMAEYNNEIKCGIDSVGVVDFVNFLTNTKSYRRKLRETEYGPLSDAEFLKSISPVNMTHNIKGKLFIAHGVNDPRVPVSDAYILIEKLKNQNKYVESLIFDDEGHGFRKKKNRIEYYKKSASFIKECYND